MHRVLSRTAFSAISSCYLRLCVVFTILLFLPGCELFKKSTADVKYEESLAAYRVRLSPEKGMGSNTDNGPGEDENSENPTGREGEGPNGTEEAVPVPEGSMNEKMIVAMQELSDKNSNIKAMKGYRILAYSGRSRETADDVYRDLRITRQATLSFESPNWKVKAGMFLDRIAAYEQLVQVRQEYPQAIIIAETIKADWDKILKSE